MRICRYIIYALFMMSAFGLYAQTTPKLKADFLAKESQIVTGELLSNVVRIENISSESITFRMTSDFPFGWKQLSRLKESYTIAAGDSLFLPLRFIPGGNLSGNNRYLISVFLADLNDQSLANEMFWAYTQKRTSWSMSSESGTKIYFKNGETEARFDVNVVNTGTETQQMVLSLNNLSLASEIRDTNNSKPVSQPINLSLAPYEDTTFRFLYVHTQGERNTKRVDTENYKPSGQDEERTFNLLVNTEEPNYGQPGAFQAGQRFVFKKLSSDRKADNQSYSHLPVIVDYNIANLFDEVSFATLNIRGTTQLSKDQQLIYNFQGSATNNQYSDFLKNNNYYIGYFGAKGSVQVGYINGGLMGIQGFGQGAKVGYRLGKRHTLTSYYVTRDDRYNREALKSYGLAYDVKYFRQNRARFEVGQSDNILTGIKTTAANGRISLNFLRTHSVNFSLSNTWNEINNIAQGRKNTFGYFAMGNYNGNFFKSKLSVNHGAGYNTKDYGSANVERFFYNHRARYMFNERWGTTLVNNYNKTTVYQTGPLQMSSFTNQFMLNRSFKTRSIQPLVFYNIFHQTTYTYNMQGLGLNYNQFNPKTNARFSTTIEGGVNNPMEIRGARQTSFLQWTTLAFYKTVTLNTRYLVGMYGYVPPSTSMIGNENQQIFMASLQHQYLFANKKIMVQTGINYFYNNVFKQHSLTLFPDIYYFTSDGWRFRVGFNYNIISSIALSNAYATQQSTANEDERITNQNTFITVGIRREFSVPIPFKQTKFYDVQFVAFFDVNGNGARDKNEKLVDNVIVKLGEEELITNTEGEATLRNIEGRLYPIAAIPLDETSGWFANIEDTVMITKGTTLPIPFVRGIKIKGKINIDRESINAESGDPFDLGRIRISASGKKTYHTLTDFSGKFEMFLPYGEYIITADEGILGTQFKYARNNYEVEVGKETDGMVISFLIIEKRRKVVKKVFTQPETTPQTAPAPPANARPAAPRNPAPRRNNPPRRR